MCPPAEAHDAPDLRTRVYKSGDMGDVRSKKMQRDWLSQSVWRWQRLIGQKS